ncbi:type II CRISPR-associated endonuclease Cas1 [Methylocystis heyeri]|uniref:CRISPR-associated endonuclease Cas1 n=1 Tax=Methylocystis heyeri TaxID=391905 RepID=A0A6B8KKA4_9HYPH|nr:type II CRISPR-associated endonuclease Cas1 [Methylocystis heyeri]QGM47068.1 type II CRISPR-associated endonuclease Cas1 [Methylocystis heyeri]
MLRKTIEIATPGTRLSVALRQLVIERPEQPKATLPIEDIGVLIVDDRRASYTQAVFIELLAAGATVMVTGPDHLPLGMMLPLDAHHVQTERHRAQIEASEPIRKQIWKALVSNKLLQQGRVLDHFGAKPNGLAAMAGRVRSGDPDNLEAQGAQRYWPLLFGKDFRRDRSAEGINAALNYGYAVVRAALARAVVASGLIPSLGVFHKNRSNPFCLADDLFEPYRPLVDWRVKLLTQERGEEPLNLENRAIRAALLSLFNETVLIGDRKLPLLLAIEAGAASLARALTAGDRTLVLPKSVPLGQDVAADTEG